MPRSPDDTETYRPASRRRRLLIVALAVATAVTIVSMLLGEPGGARLGREQRAAALAHPPTCPDGKGTNCVGGTASVIVAPPPQAASR